MPRKRRRTQEGEEAEKETSGGVEASGCEAGPRQDEAQSDIPQEGQNAPVPKKKKYRKDKPWDTPDVDKWKVEEFTKVEGFELTEESSFATLFPQYREQYLRQMWPEVVRILGEHFIKAELNLVEGSMTVRTTKRTWDPYKIIEARDLIRLLARSVPLPQAAKILKDGMYCDIIKIGGMVHNKEKFVKRRQRLVGPNASTLRALEILTECYILVSGQTVACMGDIRSLKTVRRVVENCMRNEHPVYAVKELMIRRELEKDPALANENWERFLPQFRKHNVKLKKKKPTAKKEKSLFPPLPTPRKEDLLLETGEYFVTEEQRKLLKKSKKMEQQKEKLEEKRKEREKEFEAPTTKKQHRGEVVESAKQESAIDVAEKVAKQAKKRRKEKMESGKLSGGGASLLL